MPSKVPPKLCCCNEWAKDLNALKTKNTQALTSFTKAEVMFEIMKEISVLLFTISKVTD